MCDTDFDTTHFNIFQLIGPMVLKPQWSLKKVGGLAQAQDPSMPQVPPMPKIGIMTITSTLRNTIIHDIYK